MLRGLGLPSPMESPRCEERGARGEVISMSSEALRVWLERLWSLRAFSIEYDGSPLPLRSSGRYFYVRSGPQTINLR